MEPRIKTIGLLRFSVLTPTYYSERFPTLEATAAHLFSPERMALRFHLFEKLCLPSLVRQSDPDFQAVVLTAESMPETYLERLLDLLEPLPNIHCLGVGTGVHYKLLRRAYNAVPLDGATHRILFRLDDDDALDGDFVARTRRLAAGLMDLHGPDSPFIIAHNRGFYLRRGAGDMAEVFDSCERAPLSTGTALVAPAAFPHNPYRFNHRKLAQHFNTWTDISTPAFLRSIHGDNKSNPAQMGLTHRMKEAAIDAALRRHFGITLCELRAV